jgi:hypothetical protein
MLETAPILLDQVPAKQGVHVASEVAPDVDDQVPLLHKAHCKLDVLPVAEE